MNLHKAKQILSSAKRLKYGDPEQIAAHTYWEQVELVIAAIRSCPHGAYATCDACDGHGECCTCSYQCDKCDKCDGWGYSFIEECACFDQFDASLLYDAVKEYHRRYNDDDPKKTLISPDHVCDCDGIGVCSNCERGTREAVDVGKTFDKYLSKALR